MIRNESYRKSVSDHEKEIKEYFYCYQLYRNSPLYDSKLKTVKFLYCSVRPESKPQDFIRIDEKKIVRKNMIERVFVNMNDKYILCLRGVKYRIKINQKYLTKILEEIDIPVVREMK